MIKITKEVFEQQRRPRFGTANPERMALAFWEWMIRGGTEEEAKQRGARHAGVITRDRKLKNINGPWRARDFFGIPLCREEGPIWTFDRMGATRTQLPDGRTICIGGEHEDYYDPDFCIYNDVIVFADDRIDIYGYPKEVFPPTDFHTSTSVQNRIVIIGGLGYPGTRRPGNTPVYELELSGYTISRIDTFGEMPGWIYEHSAEWDGNHSIRVTSGTKVEGPAENEEHRPNEEQYTLDLRSFQWSRIRR